jgi:prolyl-tRNA synthetase
MGGADSHEFMLPHPDGEDIFIHCETCDYAANAERAEFQLPEVESEPLEKPAQVATPGCETIADVADFIGVPTRKTLKAVFYSRGDGDLVLVVIRGDLEVNETKLRNLLDGAALEPALEEDVRNVGAEPGYGSPVGLNVRGSRDDTGVLVVADRSIQKGANFVAGANRHGYHLVGVNYPRDFAVTILGDIAQAEAGHLCPQCEGALVAESAIELGHCFKLGTHYAEAVGATYLDADGDEHPIMMGSYGIGVGRLIAAVIEEHHDDYGIIWPPALAPFDVYLLTLGTDEETQERAEFFCAELGEAGLEVLFDDREESAGVKFTDADLIGCPVRATVSRRSLERGGVELKARWADDMHVVKVDSLADAVKELVRGF